MGWMRNIVEKLNPVQRAIADEQGEQSSTQTKIRTVTNAYDLIEVVNRCVNILVDNAAMVNYDVADTYKFTGQVTNVRKDRLATLLNIRPNPFMDISTFRRLLILDLIIDGNIFIYYDGTSLYHVPAHMVTIVPDSVGFVHSYEYGTLSGVPHVYKPNEIIHIRDNSINSVYRGDSRINSCLESLYSREAMLSFQNSFFNSGTAMGMIIETDAVLSSRMKERQERDWMVKYNPKRSSGRPLILDGGMKAKSTASSNFREMAFVDSIDQMETKVCVALGIPPILLDSGNNANIKPNLELLFYLTIIPMLRKVESALEFYFAYDIQLSTHAVPALLPDQKEESDRLSSLTNNGIITGNEARKMLRLEPIDDPLMDKIRIPANVAGSATGVSGQQGGRPTEGSE
jgi:HK97 family phage portal protein